MNGPMIGVSDHRSNGHPTNSRGFRTVLAECSSKRKTPPAEVQQHGVHHFAVLAGLGVANKKTTSNLFEMFAQLRFIMTNIYI